MIDERGDTVRVTVAIDVAPVVDSPGQSTADVVAGWLVEHLETDEDLLISTTDGAMLRITGVRVVNLED